LIDFIRDLWSFLLETERYGVPGALVRCVVLFEVAFVIGVTGFAVGAPICWACGHNARVRRREEERLLDEKIAKILSH
jgi:hypothetical protein